MRAPSSRLSRGLLARAAATLRAGGLVAFPTETVYGLGGDASSDRAVAAIYAAKGRPGFNPLIIHVAEVMAALRLGRLDARAMRLARRFWPGPLTLVVPRRPGNRISRLATAGLPTLALRMPDHPIARALLQAAGRPLAAPSANRSGGVSPTRAAHVRASLGGRAPLVLDGGPSRVGVESTVIDLTRPRARLLRPGGVTVEAIEREIGPVEIGADEAQPLSPGQLASHYAPGLPVRLNRRRADASEAYLAFGPAKAATLNLSARGDLDEAATNLFAMLRALDRPEFSAIAVAPIPNTGLGRAINDRLKRAAAPR